MMEHTCNKCGSSISMILQSCDCENLAEAERRINHEREQQRIAGFNAAKNGQHVPGWASAAFADGWAQGKREDLGIASALHTDPFSAAEIKRMAVQCNTSVDIVQRLVRATVAKMEQKHG